MKHSKAKVIIILGPPGSGKGTQAGLLAEKFNLYYLETSKVGEERIKKAKKGEYILADGKKYFFEEQKKLWEKGKLWDPPFITALIEEKIKQIAKEEGGGLLLAGSPRTIYEGQKLMPFITAIYGKENIKIIELSLKAEKSIWRNSHRRICQLIRHPILYTKETSRLRNCPLDGSKLIRRKGLDDPKTIKIRLQEYETRTFPLLKFFEKQGFKIHKVDGDQSVVDVFEDILKVIK